MAEWIAFACVVALAIARAAWKRWGPVVLARIRGGRVLRVEGMGTEVPNPHLSYVQDRDGTFWFKVQSGTMAIKGHSVSLEIDIRHHHIDGQETSARCTGAGVLLGGYAYVIYTTTEDPPATGQWTGVGILRLTASGRSLGWWITEDIYQPGFFMHGIARMWPKGSDPDSSDDIPVDV